MSKCTQLLSDCAACITPPALASNAGASPSSSNDPFDPVTPPTGVPLPGAPRGGHLSWGHEVMGDENWASLLECTSPTEHDTLGGQQGGGAGGSSSGQGEAVGGQGMGTGGSAEKAGGGASVDKA